MFKRQFKWLNTCDCDQDPNGCSTKKSQHNVFAFIIYRGIQFFLFHIFFSLSRYDYWRRCYMAFYMKKNINKIHNNTRYNKIKNF